MRARIVRLAVALVAAMAVAVPAGAAPVPTPFTANLTAQGSFVPTAEEGVFAGTVVGAGRATHLGRVTVSSTETVDFTSPTGEVLVQDGQMVVVAANGDELHWSYSGTGTPPDANGDFALSGTFAITGGTGRFADATGGGTFGGPASVVTFTADVVYRGAITW